MSVGLLLIGDECLLAVDCALRRVPRRREVAGALGAGLFLRWSHVAKGDV